MIIRPHFFPGQQISHQDFNRLAMQADDVVSQYAKVLFPQGAILVGRSKSFHVTPEAEHQVRVKPGMAVLPNGRIVELLEEKILDLKPYIRGSRARVLVVGIQDKVQATDHFVDEEDPAVRGYKSETLEPDFVFSEGALQANAVEIFRVSLSGATGQLKQSDSHIEPQEGVIDLRFQSRVAPPGFLPFDLRKWQLAQNALGAFASAIESLQATYPFLNVTPLHLVTFETRGALYERPFQLEKFAYFAGELTLQLRKLLDHLLHAIPNARADLDRELAYELLSDLEHWSQFEVFPRVQEIDLLTYSLKKFERLANQASEKREFDVRIGEYLSEHQRRHLDFDPKISLAAHVFNKVDEIPWNEVERLDVKGPEVLRQNIISRYEDCAAVERPAQLIQSGTIKARFKVNHLDRPCILLLPVFQRGNLPKLEVILNGQSLKPLFQPKEEIGFCNMAYWVFPHSLTGEANQLLIRVPEHPGRYGFFGLHAYQPQSARGDR